MYLLSDVHQGLEYRDKTSTPLRYINAGREAAGEGREIGRWGLKILNIA